jgi:hypothetical protein
MECYACSNEASRQCRRCARVYCEVHGGDLCAECLNPASALPSFNLYRGSLLALLIGTAVAIWLLIQPPGSSNGDDDVIISQLGTPTAIVTVESDTPEADGTAEADETAENTPASTAAPARTGTPPASATPELREYEVQDGDTLFSVAETFAPPGVDAVTYAAQIAFSSGLGSVDDPIAPGQILILP